MRLFLLCLVLNVGCLTYGQEKKDAAYWQRAYKQDPNNTLNMFNMGVIHQQKKKYKQAFGLYKKVIKTGSPLTPICNFYIARVYKEINKLDKAIQYIDRVDVKTMPKNFRKRVLLFKNSLYIASTDETEEEKPEETDDIEEKNFSLYFEIGGGTVDNPTYAESDADSDIQSQAKLNFDYQIMAGDTYEFKTDYSFNAVLYSENHDVSTTYHDLILPWAYYFGSFRYRFLPEVIADTYGGNLYSTTYGAAMDISQKVDASYFTFYIQHSGTKVADDDEDYLNGAFNKFKYTWKKRWESSQTAFAIGYNDYIYNDSDSVTSSYKAPLVSFTYTKYWEYWDATFYIQYEDREYNEDSSEFVREDERLTSSLRVGRGLGERFRVFLEAAHSSNTSNESDNEYTQTYAILGFSGGF